MVDSHVIGRDYEYRVRNWFIKQGWKAERNPLSGASDQIEDELGKHDVRCWRDDLSIFLQLECKKKSTTKDILDIKKEWIDKIDFDNDELLVFSFKNCKQHFAFLTKEAADKVLGRMKLRKSETYEPRGDKVFGFKREWVEFKEEEIFVVNFMGKTWYTLDLGTYVTARENYKTVITPKTVAEKLKFINDAKKLKAFRKEDGENWDTKENRLYYAKLERLESGEENKYNPNFIKESQWWLSEEKRFDWDENTMKQITALVEKWLDKNLEESQDGELLWVMNEPVESLEKDIRKILGIKNDRKSK